MQVLARKEKFFCDSCAGLQEAQKRMLVKALRPSRSTESALAASGCNIRPSIHPGPRRSLPTCACTAHVQAGSAERAFGAPGPGPESCSNAGAEREGTLHRALRRRRRCLRFT